MPIYSVEAPNGKIYDVEAPEGTSERAIFAFAQQAYLNDMPKDVTAPRPNDGIVAPLKPPMPAGVEGLTGPTPFTFASRAAFSAKAR